MTKILDDLKTDLGDDKRRAGEWLRSKRPLAVAFLLGGIVGAVLVRWFA